MTREYEELCRKFGMNEEQIHELKKSQQREKKKYRRKRKLREKKSISFYYVSGISTEQIDALEIADSNPGVEETVLHNLDIERIHKCLSRLAQPDRDFLLRIYGDERVINRWTEKEMAEQFGLSIATYYRKKKKLLDELKKEFLENY